MEVDMEEAAESGDLEGPTLVEKAMAGAANSIRCLASTAATEEKEGDLKSCVEDPAVPGDGSAPDILVGIGVEPSASCGSKAGEGEREELMLSFMEPADARQAFDAKAMPCLSCP